MRNLKILLALLFFATLTIVACNKDSLTPTTTDDSELVTNDDDVEVNIDNIESEDDIVDKETEERGTDPFSITSIACSNTNLYGVKTGSGECTKFDGKDFLQSADEVPITITGVGFGTRASTDFVKAVYKKDTLSSSAVEIQDWSDTQITLLFTMPGRDTAKNATIKFVVGNTVRKTSSTDTTYSEKKKSKSLKFVGSNGGNLYGSSAWLIKKLKGSIPTGTGTAIDTSAANLYTPVVGDVLSRDNSKWTGYVVAVTDKPSTKYPARKQFEVHEMNHECKGTIKKKKYYIAQGLAPIKKAYETTFYTHYKR